MPSPATISAISCRSTALGTSRNIGSSTPLGAHTGSRENIDEACPPLWLSCAKIGTLYACAALIFW